MVPRVAMGGLIITRTRLVGVSLGALLCVGAAIWFYQPDRQLRRAWGDLLDAVEARNPRRLGRLVAEDYHDRWGYTRRTVLEDARLAFLQFRKLVVDAEQVRVDRHDDGAVVTAILRLEADGRGQVHEARAAVNALFTPFSFTWRREPGFGGAWKLVSFDHPELDLGRFRVRWGAGG